MGIEVDIVRFAEKIVELRKDKKMVYDSSWCE